MIHALVAFMVVLLPALAAQEQPTPTPRYMGPCRPLRAVTDQGNVDMATGPQVAVCYNPVDDEFFFVVQVTKYNSAGVEALLVGQRLRAATGVFIGGTVPIDDGSLGQQVGSERQISAPTVAHCAATNRYMVCYRWSTYPLAKVLDHAGTIVHPGNREDNVGRVILNDAWESGDWPLGLEESPISIASDDGGFVVVFCDWSQAHSQDLGLWARRYDRDGRAAGLKVRIGPASEMHDLRHLGGASNRYLVVHTTPILVGGGVDATTTINSLTLGIEGNALVAGPPRALSSPDGKRHLWPRLAADPADQEWMVVWESSDSNLWSGYGVHDFVDKYMEEDPPTQGRIVYRRVDGSGLPVGGGEIEATASVNLAPSVAWCDVDNVYLVHWQAGDLGHESIAAAKFRWGHDRPFVSGRPVATVATDPPPQLSPFLAARTGHAQALSLWGSGHQLQGAVVDFLRPPLVPSGLVQVLQDGLTPIARGGMTRGSTVLLQAVPGDLEDDSLIVELQVLPATAPFDSDEPTHATTLPIASGGVVTLTVTELPLDTPHHWRARTVNGFNRKSRWAAFPADPAFVTRANEAPLVRMVSQFRRSGVALGAGQPVQDGILLRAGVDDEDRVRVRFEAEIRPVGVPFLDEATASERFEGVGMISLWVRLPADRYHWQYRAVDPYGARSPWTAFGVNDEDAADFEATSSGSDGRGSCASSGAGQKGIFPAVCLVVLAAAALRIR